MERYVAVGAQGQPAGSPGGHTGFGCDIQDPHPTIAMKLTRIIAAFSLPLGLALALGSCKQKEGEICQIDDDCESGLICNAATGRCQPRGQVTPDAMPGQDAAPVDAGVDAPVDATVDSSS